MSSVGPHSQALHAATKSEARSAKTWLYLDNGLALALFQGNMRAMLGLFEGYIGVILG